MFSSYTSLSLSDMDTSKNRFKAASLEGSKVNISNDDDFSKSNVEILKHLSSGGEIFSERKNENPHRFFNTAKLIICTNKPVVVNDDTHSFYDRMLFIEVLFEIRDESKQNPNFCDVDWWGKKEDELSWFLNWAIEGWTRLQQQKKFTVLPKYNEIIEEARNYNSPEREFLLSHFESNQNSLKPVFTKEIYSQYSQWAKGYGHKPLSASQLGRSIKLIFKTAYKPKSPLYDNKGVRRNAWMGISSVNLSSIESMGDSNIDSSTGEILDIEEEKSES